MAGVFLKCLALDVTIDPTGSLVARAADKRLHRIAARRCRASPARDRNANIAPDETEGPLRVIWTEKSRRASLHDIHWFNQAKIS